MKQTEFKAENYENVHKLMLDVARVHAKLFPKATLISQIAKYEEETKELQEASELEECMEEYADMFIVACGIGRFSAIVGYDLCNYLLMGMTNSRDYQSLIENVCKKMNKNIKRSWGEIEDGYYKHKIPNIN